MELTPEEAQSLKNALSFLDENELFPKFMQELYEEPVLELSGLE
jgi:hypothetical protein